VAAARGTDRIRDMGSLFDELKKAKLLDEKKAKRLAHEKRVERKAKGGGRAEDEEEARKRRAFEEKKRAEAETQRRAAHARREEEKKKERRSRLRQWIASRAVEDRGEKTRPWYFLAEGGRIPWLPVSSDTARRLAAGEYGIVEDPAVDWPRFVIVPREVALELRDLEPGKLRFLSGITEPSAR